MKTLAESLFDSKTQTMESLFDKDLVEKNLTFGDMYEPICIHHGNNPANIKAIGNMFVISKLKTIEPMSLDGVPGYDNYKKLLVYLPYVLAKVGELPLEEKFVNTKSDGNYIKYEFKMSDMFREYQRTNGNKLSFTIRIMDWKPTLQICKSTMTGISSILIDYEKK